MRALAGFAILVAAAALAGACGGVAERIAPVSVRVMSFNAWGAGLNDGRPLEDTLRVLAAVDADIIGLQETRAESALCEADDCRAEGPSVAPELAAALGYHVWEPSLGNDALWASAILSRHPVVAVMPNELGVVIDTGELRIGMFNVHFTDFPYQPYQLTGIPYGDAPFLDEPDAAIRAARAARGNAVELLLRDVAALPPVDAVFITGDFNEPSHRDWTPRAAEAGRHPLVVSWPATRALEAAGFVDTYREAWPDELARPGFTWTPSVAADAPYEHHDRIDFVFARGNALEVESAAIVGEDESVAEIVVTPWPSDHRATVADLAVVPAAHASGRGRRDQRNE